MGRKIIIVLLLLITIGVGYFAYTFYTQKETLTQDIAALKNAQTKLNQENSTLKNQLSALEREKRSLEDRWAKVQSRLAEMEKEGATLRRKYKDVVKDKDALVEKLNAKPKVQVTERVASASSQSQAPAGSDDYWADFVRAKAELSIKLDDMNKKLTTAKITLSEREKKNKELSLEIDELEALKKQVEDQVQFKTRALEIVSKELVNEREARKNLTDETMKMRKSGVKLKRELVLANKEKVQLQKSVEGMTSEKDKLEKRISEIERILKQKALALQDLQDNLYQALNPNTVIKQDSASVGLPPIVVKPDVAGVKGLRGEIVAVNHEEKFIIVDIGETKGMRPGFRLKILRGDKEIGTAQVIETRREISAADIKEVSGGYTIQEGDAIISK
ncbi:MAG: hypothetical protein GY858_05740 [Candidatus Omnitrophica bacterium]|nr:hypothetical protein [Candidatus Omnitrophota bacterium]